MQSVLSNMATVKGIGLGLLAMVNGLEHNNKGCCIHLHICTHLQPHLADAFNKINVYPVNSLLVSPSGGCSWLGWVGRDGVCRLPQVQVTYQHHAPHRLNPMF